MTAITLRSPRLSVLTRIRRVAILAVADWFHDEADKLKAEREGYEETCLVGDVYLRISRDEEAKARLTAMKLETLL